MRCRPGSPPSGPDTSGPSGRLRPGRHSGEWVRPAARAADSACVTTTVCDAVCWAGISAATLSGGEGLPGLFLAAGWLSTAVTAALEQIELPLAVPLS